MIICKDKKKVPAIISEESIYQATNSASACSLDRNITVSLQHVNREQLKQHNQTQTVNATHRTQNTQPKHLMKI